MSNLDLLKMSLKNLWRRRLRTVLTILGVVIGCASIVVMLSLGYGMKKNTETQLENMGDIDILTVNNYPFYGENNSQKDAAVLDDKAVQTISKYNNVVAVLPLLNVEDVTLISGKYMTWASVLGVDTKALEEFNFKITKGRLMTPDDHQVAIIGGQIKSGWHKPNSRNNDSKDIDWETDKIELGLVSSTDEFGKTTYKKKLKLNVIGELNEEDWSKAWNIYVPMEFAEKIIHEKKRAEKQLNTNNPDQYSNNFRDNRNRNKNKSKYSSILVKVNDIKNMQQLQDDLRAANFNAQSNIEVITALNKSVATQQKILGGIGAISLIVAAIGIANTMVMSIYERIKEIGIMKVIGASIKDIRKLFLTEAALIGIIGGIAGIIVSYLISFLLNYYSKNGGSANILGGGFMGGAEGAQISIIPIWLIGAAVLFSALIGILSGYYPAKKATSISALEAIRTQ